MQPDRLALNLQAQHELYGEPLGERFRRLIETLSLTQAQLAATLGVSAPMLSQLMSGKRVKIGNPAVIQRIGALSELADDVDDGRAGPDDVRRRLTEVRDFSGVLTRSTHHDSTPSTGSRSTADDVVNAVRGLLRAVASGQEIEDVAAAIAPEHAGLAEVIRVYGVGRRDEALDHFARHQHLF